MDHIKRDIIRLWDQWLELNLRSAFYDVSSFIKGKGSLTFIEKRELGDLEGKSVLHLQCHFGMDSIDLARQGARVTGIDISFRSIEEAKKLALKCHQNVKFICCDLYDLKDHIEDSKFDIVFTSYGVIPWLHDLEEWAATIRYFLKAEGFFYLAEFHPLFYMFNPESGSIEYPYDSNGEPLVFRNVPSYAEPTINLENTEYTWAHGISSVVNPIIGNAMTLDFLNEYNFSPIKLSDDMIEIGPGKWRFRNKGDLMPYVFTLMARPKK